MENTGFKCVNDELFVGDKLAWYSGNMGFFEIVKRPDGYWLVDCSEYEDERNHDIRLDEDLDAHFTKVDKDDPFNDILRINAEMDAKFDAIADAMCTEGEPF